MLYLTRDERRVIVFLLAMAFLGTGVNFLSKKFYPAHAVRCFSQEVGKIDLNEADYHALTGVSGIGDAIARRILEYRNNHGVFKDKEELKNIKGVYQSRYEKIKDSFIIR